MYTETDVADKLSIRPETVHHLVRSGRLDATFGADGYLIPPEALDRFCAALATPTTPH
ncbi:helix-turn-helix domain-containing protein [Longispora sp. NPDC051575]|uniref:helix-turn-helix domain-containing protein n=1 Tax=Longispora sp. NPDC051575 TaxID=3154943 RepID=UPI00342C48E2